MLYASKTGIVYKERKTRKLNDVESKQYFAENLFYDFN